MCYVILLNLIHSSLKNDVYWSLKESLRKEVLASFLEVSVVQQKQWICIYNN